MKTFIPTMANNKYTKIKGFSAFCGFKSEALLHHHLASLVSHGHY